MTERWMTLRVYGNVLYQTGAWGINDSGDVSTASPLTENDIDAWMNDCARHGATAVLWQSNCGGTSTHPSPVFPLPGPPLPPHNEAWEPVWDFLGQQVRRFDTLNAAVAAAHRHGLRFVYSLCLWDFVDSPFDAGVFHPRLWLLSRTGEPFLGVPCYAEPQVRQLLLQHVTDVLDRGVDDLAVSFFAHTQGQGVDLPDYYAFNPPLVQAYKSRYGVDPRSEPFEPAALHSLHGDFHTEFLRLLHHETSQRGRRLIPCTSHDGRWGWGGPAGSQLFNYYNTGGSPPELNPSCGIEFQWQRWAAEGVADALLLTAPPPHAVSLAQTVRRKSDLPVLLWRKVNPGTAPEHWDLYQLEAAQIAAGQLDGLVIHPMVNTNYGDYPDRLWALMHSAR